MQLPTSLQSHPKPHLLRAREPRNHSVVDSSPRSHLGPMGSLCIVRMHLAQDPGAGWAGTGFGGHCMAAWGPPGSVGCGWCSLWTQVLDSPPPWVCISVGLSLSLPFISFWFTIHFCFRLCFHATLSLRSISLFLYISPWHPTYSPKLRNLSMPFPKPASWGCCPQGPQNPLCPLCLPPSCRASPGLLERKGQSDFSPAGAGPGTALSTALPQGPLPSGDFKTTI